MIGAAGATGNKTGTISGSEYWSAFVLALAPEPQASSSAAGTYTYDANGNMSSDGTKCYEYNDANQLKKVKTCGNNQTIAEYVYDYNGIRLVKKNYTNGTLANTVISWHKGFETKDVVGGSITTTNYYFANKELVAKKNPDGSKQYYHADHLGSSTVISNQGGTLVEETAFDPWGKVLSGGTQSKYQYTGQERDTETDLNYFNARYQDPNLQRFTQPDSVVQNVYDPQMLNRYAYARNNPLKYTDPSGNVITCGRNGCSSDIHFINNQMQKGNQSPRNSKAPLPSQQIASVLGSSAKQSNNTKSSGNTNNNNTSRPSNSVLESNSNSKHTNSPNVAKNTAMYIANSYNRGNIDIGVNFGTRRLLGGGFGGQINREGITPYLAGGLVVGKFGGAVLFSEDPPEENTATFNVQTTIPIVEKFGYANNISFPFNDSFLSPRVTHGAGYGAGVSATINYNFNTIKWP